MRKLIDFDDDTLDKLTRLGRDRMATLQELADEAFADLMKKHGVPIDLRDALKKSIRAGAAAKAAPDEASRNKISRAPAGARSRSTARKSPRATSRQIAGR